MEGHNRFIYLWGFDMKHLKKIISIFKDAHVKLPSGCWGWNRYIHPDGYGLLCCYMRKSSYTLRAHRVSYELFKGAVPKDKHVLHQCDNRYCCNPNHLYLGTDKDNALDIIQRGHNPGWIQKGDRVWAKLVSENKRKFSDEDIIKMKKLIKKGWSQKQIANKYGVNPSNVSRALNGKRLAYGG